MTSTTAPAVPDGHKLGFAFAWTSAEGAGTSEAFFVPAKGATCQTVAATDVRVTNNSAGWGGGVAHWGPGPQGVGSATRVTYSGNQPQDVVGDFPR